jgi:GAF domain-containing protein
VPIIRPVTVSLSVSQDDRLQALMALTHAVSASLDIREALRAVTRVAAEVASPSVVSFWEVDERTATATLAAVSDEELFADFPVKRLRFGEGVVGEVARTRRPIRVADVFADPRIEFPEWIRRRGLGSLDAIPILFEDTVLGILTCSRRVSLPDTDDRHALFSFLVDQAAIVVRNAKRIDALLEVNRRLSSIQSLEALLASMAEACGRLVASDSVAFRVVEGDELVLTGTWGDAASMSLTPRLRIGESLSGAVASTGQPLNLTDALDDPRHHPVHREAMRRLGYRAWLGVPLKRGERLLGVLNMRTHRAEGFSEGDVSIATAFASQAAIALENARLYADAERRRQTAERLADVGRLISQSRDLETLAQQLVDHLRQLVPGLRAAFFRGDPMSDDLHLVAASNDPTIAIAPGVVFPHGTGVPGLAARERRLVVIHDILDDPSVLFDPEQRACWASTPVRAVAAVPLLAADSILGVLIVSDRAGRVFSDEERRILEMFAAQATAALENARLFAETRRKTQRLEVLHRLALDLTATLGTQEVFTRVARAALELFGDVGSSLWLLDHESGELTLVADEGIRFPELRKTGSMKVGQGMMGQVVAERRAIVLDDIQARGHNQALSEAEGFRTAMAVPLLFGERCHGGLSVRRRSAEPFGPEDVDMLNALAGHAAITIEQARLYEGLRAKNGELDSFASAVSHDLKAPLVSLQGMAGLLAEDCGEQLGEDGRHYLKRILSTVGQMETLIADVLMLARVGREGRAPETVSLDEVVDLVLDRQSEALRARNVRVTRAPLGEVQAIPTQVEQVLSNLIGNAIKYMGDTAEPAIEIGRVEQQGGVEYFVRDNGIGIDPAYHDRIFQAFQRLKDVEVEGSGVGLAIVKKIIESAGGKLRVESRAGEGSTFFFTWRRID